MERPTMVIAEVETNSRERIRVALTQYMGADLIDIRVACKLTEATGIFTPTKKGLSIKLSLLPWLIPALEEARDKARVMGLLDG